jgi:hypothetical protein
MSAWADEITGVVDKVDTKNHTISVGGETIKVPEGMNISGIEEGSRYQIMYSGEGENKTLTEFTEKQK